MSALAGTTELGGGVRRWPAEWSEPAADPETGATVRRLTNYAAHSYHLYFTNPGWHDGGRRLLFGSERQNQGNLYSLDLESGEILQLTDLPATGSKRASFQNACVNPTREEAYFWHRRVLYAIDLTNGAARPLWSAPDGWQTGILNATADGRSLCTPLTEDLSGQIRMDLGNGYVGFREYFEAHARSRLLRVGIDDGRVDELIEERHWIGHVNTSSTQPHLLTYCHEGPWDLVDHRIWAFDLNQGKRWPLRERRQPGERVGHEYWFADGLHVGYHGTAEGVPFYGAVRFDGTPLAEATFPGGSTHFHSNDISLIVGDGSGRNPYILLWRYRDGQFEGPRRVFRHRGSFHTQHLHVHPRFSPDGRHIVCTADPDGYGNLYQVETPEFEQLPEAAQG